MLLGPVVKQKRPKVEFSQPWSERLSRLRFDRFGFVLIFCLLGAGGVAWVFQAAGSRRQTEAAQAPVLHTFEVQIEGEVVGLSEAQLKQSEVTLSFPQLPYQMTRSWQEMPHPRPGVFVVPFQLRAPGAASLCQLSLQLGPKRLRGSKVQVEAGKAKAVLPPFQVKL